MHAAPDPRGVRGVVAEEVGRVLQPPVLGHDHLRRRDFREKCTFILHNRGIGVIHHTCIILLEGAFGLIDRKLPLKRAN